MIPIPEVTGAGGLSGDAQASIKLSSPETHGFWEVDVLFEDRDLMALSKPFGLLSSPDCHESLKPSLIDLLHAGIAAGKPWAKNRQLCYCKNVYQLDLEISGIFLLAKSKRVQAQLADLFGSGKSLTRFIALVQGQPSRDLFEVSAKLAPHPERANLVRIDPRNGKRSLTVFRVRERFSGWTLLSCEPSTLRKHQIRVHLKSAGLPVAGDPLYGGKPLLLSRLKREYRLKPEQAERPLICRPALHLEELSLPHPATGAKLTISAPWPKDIQVGIKYLRRYAGAPGAA
jgi:23S rRNA pseudouridine1911/1915/1917 synthase